MNLQEYYTYYLSLHQNAWNRRLHVLGQIATICFLICTLHYTIFVSNAFAFGLILVPFVVYPFTYVGHFVFEKNTPASLSRPIMAKICDWMMLWDILRGRITL
jgi:hypothetical protein